MMTAETLIRILPLEAELTEQIMNQGAEVTDPMNPQVEVDLTGQMMTAETLIRILPLEAELKDQTMNQGVEAIDPMNLTT
jgi:hypothetical protein